MLSQEIPTASPSNERPKRKMPGWRKIMRHNLLPDFLTPFCFACGGEPYEEPTAYHRAHLIDRILGGLDGPQNFVLLCEPCHRAMPSFAPGFEAAARRWVYERPTDIERYLAMVPQVTELVEQGIDFETAVKSVVGRWRGR